MESRSNKEIDEKYQQLIPHYLYRYGGHFGQLLKKISKEFDELRELEKNMAF